MDGAESEIEKASAGSKSESGLSGTVIVLVGTLAAKARTPLVGVKSSPGAVPPVAVPLLVVKLTVAGTVSGPVRRTVAMTDLAVSATVTCEAVKANVGSRSVMVRTVELGAPRAGAAAGRVQGDHDSLVAFGRAVGHGVDVDRLHGLARAKGQRGGAEGVVGAASGGGARDRVAHGDAAAPPLRVTLRSIPPPSATV